MENEEEYSDEEWLKQDIIQCPNCEEDLLWIEHSPFENGYYLYCNSCPKRVDVSIYDETFSEIEDSLAEKFGDSFRGNYFETIMPIVEERLTPCECGGKYISEAIRRCVYCNHPVIEGERNLWFVEFSEDSPEAVKFYKRLVKDENLWK